MRVRVVLMLLLTIALSALLGPPPDPRFLLSKVAELVLRAKLRDAGSVDVDVEAPSLLSGRVDRVRVRGQRWCTPLSLSCRSLDLSVRSTAIDFGALIGRQRIELIKPALGAATISFTEADFANFLAHPLMTEAVARHARRVPPPQGFAFGRAVRMLPPGDAVAGAAGAVTFPVTCNAAAADGRPTVLLMQQAAGGSIIVQRLSAGSPEDAEAAATCRWIASLFAGLLIDLDGCALTFQSMRFVASAPQTFPSAGKTSGAVELELDLHVRVTSFPSLSLKF